MISLTIVKRIRAALWYAIDIHGRHGTEADLANARLALSSMPGTPTIDEAWAALRSATKIARVAASRYKKIYAVTCMTGFRIMQDLSTTRQTLKKLEKKLKEQHDNR